MPRSARQHSETGFYHVMVRGNGKQILFECDSDREFYLTKLYFCFKSEGIVVLAWCLMDNHAHLLVLDNNWHLPTAMARANGAYARYYNERSGHVGHVFQDRYRCEPINNEKHLLEAFRYIHNNPEEARLSRAENYRWSSYHEYMGSPRLVDITIMLDIFGSRKQLKKFCREKSDPEFRIRHVLNPTSDVLLDIARDALSPADPTRLSALPRKERDQQLMRLRDTGFTLRQIERLTGIGKSTIVDATRVYAPSPVQKEPSPMDG